MGGVDPFYGWQELGEHIADNVSFGLDLAREIGKSYCRIRQKYPIQNTRITNPLGLPVIDFCSKHGIDSPPPVPPPPFTGGQCGGVLYRVRATATAQCKVSSYGVECGDTVEIELSNSYKGKIISVTPFIGNSNNYFCTVIYDNGFGNNQGNDNFAFVFNENRVSWRLKHGDSCDNSQIDLINDIRNIRFYRVDGQIDECGDPPPDYPPDPDIDARDFSQTYNYTYITNQGDEITEEYTINYDNSDGTDFYFPIMGFIADVDFNADIEFNLDLGGITINRRGGGGGGGGGGGDYGDNLPAPSEDNSEETQTDDEEKIFIKQPKPPEEESQDTGLKRLDYITIDIIQKPSNAPRQDGTPGDDIYFPGFAEFKSGGYNYPRIPLHFERNILRAPDGANGYAVRFYPGYKGQITVYTRK